MNSLASKNIRKKSLDNRLKKKSGYLPNQYISLLPHLGIIQAEEPIEDKQFQPVSLDLRLGEKAYRIQSSFLPEN